MKNFRIFFIRLLVIFYSFLPFNQKRKNNIIDFVFSHFSPIFTKMSYYEYWRRSNQSFERILVPNYNDMFSDVGNITLKTSTVPLVSVIIPSEVKLQAF